MLQGARQHEFSKEQSKLSHKIGFLIKVLGELLLSLPVRAFQFECPRLIYDHAKHKEQGAPKYGIALSYYVSHRNKSLDDL